MQPLLSAVELKVILSFSELCPAPWGVQMVGPDLLESSRWWGQYKCMTESNSRHSFLQSSAEPIRKVTGKALSDGLREAFEGQISCRPSSCSCWVTVVVTSHLPLGSYLYLRHVCNHAILSWETSCGTWRYPSQDDGAVESKSEAHIPAVILWGCISSSLKPECMQIKTVLPCSRVCCEN